MKHPDKLGDKHQRTHRYPNYWYRVAIALDEFINVVLGGRLHQTLSARQYERKRAKKLNAVALIDAIFWWDKDHCLNSWVFYKTRHNLR
jgi:hypothetical protein